MSLMVERRVFDSSVSKDDRPSRKAPISDLTLGIGLFKSGRDAGVGTAPPIYRTVQLE